MDLCDRQKSRRSRNNVWLHRSLDRAPLEHRDGFSQPARYHVTLQEDQNEARWAVLLVLQQTVNSTKHCKNESLRVN